MIDLFVGIFVALVFVGLLWSIAWLAAPSSGKLANPKTSSIDLPEHDIERADDRRGIGKHVPAA